MAENTKIEWCDDTFNPWIGCTKVGPGCDHCYAEADFDHRKHWVEWGAGNARRRTSVANWTTPLRWNKRPFAECVACGWRGEERSTDLGGTHCPVCHAPALKTVRRRVFCASLADVFDNEVPVEWRADLFDLIARTPNLDWLLVTKRIGNVERMVMDALRTMFVRTNQEPPTWPWANVWMGITVVNQAEADRDIPKLAQVPAAVRFLSMEPLLGPVDLRFHIFSEPTGNFRTHAGKRQMELRKPLDGGLDWVIVGGESGPRARPMHPKWVRDIRDQCVAASVPFLFKQHGEWLATDFCDDDMASIPSKRTVYVRRDGSFHDGSQGVDFFGGDQETAWVNKKAAGRLLDGLEYNGFPAR